MLKPGWMKREIEDARKQVAGYPEWLKKASGTGACRMETLDIGQRVKMADHVMIHRTRTGRITKVTVHYTVRQDARGDYPEVDTHVYARDVEPLGQEQPASPSP